MDCQKLLCVCCCRGDKLKARGLDPKEASDAKEINEAAGDDAHLKSIDHLLSENKQQTKDSGTSNNNNDHSPSTPVAPSLNVPIVAHANKGRGRQQHYDERNTSITTGVSAFSRAVTSRLS